MDNKFPKEFLWGAATSAYQVEGAATTHGKKLSQQDVMKDLALRQQKSQVMNIIIIKKTLL